MTECVSLKKQYFDESFAIHYFLWKAVWKQQEKSVLSVAPFQVDVREVLTNCYTLMFG